MIGQVNLQSRIEQLIKNHTFPRFSILVGLKGSGKKTFANWIRQIMGLDNLVISYVVTDVKIDTIRDVISQAYKTVIPTIYIIPDADNMSNAAKNALLKVTEEPPNEAYFIMTLEDENNTLETIRSRATIFHMDRYTPDEIEEYFKKRFGVLEDREISIVRDLCETPGDVEIIMSYDATNFYDYVQLVVDNIAEVSLANAFKIPSKVALKDDAEGYDLRLFWKAFMNILANTDRPHDFRDFGAIPITSKYLQKLRIKGINRQMLIDCWLMEIRELWM